MILEADVTFFSNTFGETLECLEFAVGNHLIPLGCPEGIFAYLNTILGMGNLSVFQADNDCIPFTGRLNCFRICGKHII